MSILENLPHSATAYRRQRVRDTVGGSRDALGTAVFTDMDCWRQRASNNEITEFNKRGVSVTDKVFFAADPGLDENHILVIDGKTYDVISVVEPVKEDSIGSVWCVNVNYKTTERV